MWVQALDVRDITRKGRPWLSHGSISGTCTFNLTPLDRFRDTSVSRTLGLRTTVRQTFQGVCMSADTVSDGDTFYGISSGSNSTGAPGSTGGSATSNAGELSGSESVFGTSVSNSTGAPGGPSGQSAADALTQSVTVDPYGSGQFGSQSVTGHTAPSYEPIAGDYSTDTGADSAVSVNHDHGLINKIRNSKNGNN